MIDYNNYLKSKHWHTVKEAFSKRRKKQCQICNSKTKINCHHIRYYSKGVSILGHERFGDLMWLCEYCHTFIHENSLDKDIRSGLIKLKDIKKLKAFKKPSKKKTSISKMRKLGISKWVGDMKL